MHHDKKLTSSSATASPWAAAAATATATATTPSFFLGKHGPTTRAALSPTHNGALDHAQTGPNGPTRARRPRIARHQHLHTHTKWRAMHGAQGPVVSGDVWMDAAKNEQDRWLLCPS